MNEREPEESSQALKGIFFLNLGLVLVFSALLLQGWLSPLPEVSPSGEVGLAEGSVPASVGRNPAAESSSRTGSSTATDSAPPTQSRWMASIELGCPSTGEPIRETQAKRIRLLGPNCSLGLEGAKRTLLVNESNGHQATLFHLSQAQSFTTDYIDLVEGENRIRISQLVEEGQRLESHLVIRRSVHPTEP